MKNIHIVPTDKPSRLHNYTFDGLGLSKKVLNWKEARHIYITSKEEISGFENNIWVIIGTRVFLWQNTMALVSSNKPKKIILTTDQDLIKDRIQSIPDEFLEFIVKNPSCEEVEIEIECTNCDDCNCHYHDPCLKPKYNIVKDMIRYSKEEPKKHKVIIVGNGIPKQETLEEVAERILFENTKNVEIRYRGGRDSVIKSMLDIAKWQQQQNKKLYSEEDIMNALHSVELKYNRDFTKIYEGVLKYLKQITL
jgi:hypothetical protein